ncbi:MAG: hypothetical protein Q7U02_09435 [Desulfosalsimonadaceae bacterium]|nr:hypothetical protein [Desulfosalsimonadaceae bacterium]
MFNSKRLLNHELILTRLSVEIPQETQKAWENWRKFRAAQFEVASIFLIEKFLSSKNLQLIPESKVPTPDFKIILNQRELHVEVKARSGQQHGDKHPSENGAILFDPEDEKNFRAWLFEEKKSSRSKEPMRPMALEAERKGSEILLCQTDYTATTPDLNSQVATLCPKAKFIEKISVNDSGTSSIAINFYKVDFPCSHKINILEEIWLYNLAHLDEFIVLYQKESNLLNHLVDIKQ